MSHRRVLIIAEISADRRSFTQVCGALEVETYLDEAWLAAEYVVRVGASTSLDKQPVDAGESLSRSRSCPSHQMIYFLVSQVFRKVVKILYCSTL